MIGIVRVALSRPYTFVVMAVLVLIFGITSVIRTPKDIFPDINLPVVSVVFSYTGMPPDVYQQLRAHSEYRIVFDADLPSIPQNFRHLGLMTPQGFDPFLTTALRKLATDKWTLHN